MNQKHTKNITEPPIYVEDPKGKLHKYSVKICASGQREVQGRFGDRIIKFRAETREELENWIATQWKELDAKKGVNITFYNAALQYIEKRSALAETTRATYRRILDAYFKPIHNKPIMKLTKADFYEAVNYELDRGMSRKTMKNALAFLTCVCTEYEVPAFTRKIQSDINRYSQHSSNRGRKAGNDWESLPSACEVAEWSSECDLVTAIAILLDLHSLRSEETRGLKYCDVIQQNGACYINVCRTRSVIGCRDVYREGTKTDSSTRKILIDRRLYDMIHGQPHDSEGDFVVDQTYRVYRTRIKSLMAEHGFDWITPHDLRHIFKTEHMGDPVATAVGGWTAKGNVAETVYTHIKQADKDVLMRGYSTKLLDSYEHIETPIIRIISCTA